jgi:hypothetical protein
MREHALLRVLHVAVGARPDAPDRILSSMTDSARSRFPSLTASPTTRCPGLAAPARGAMPPSPTAAQPQSRAYPSIQQNLDRIYSKFSKFFKRTNDSSRCLSVRTYRVQSLLILVQACNQTIQSIQSRSNGFIWKWLNIK